MLNQSSENISGSLDKLNYLFMISMCMFLKQNVNKILFPHWMFAGSQMALIDFSHLCVYVLYLKGTNSPL